MIPTTDPDARATTRTRTATAPRLDPLARRRRLAPLALVLLLGAATTGCAGDDGAADRPGASDSAGTADAAATPPGASASASGASPHAAADGIAAMDPWVRVAIVPEPPATGEAPPVNSAAYVRLTNATDSADALVGVETALADTAEIHSVSMDGGVMRMRAVDSVVVPAGGEAVLEPGGYHVMLIGLREPLEEGATVALTLRLRSGRVLELSAPVRRQPPR